MADPIERLLMMPPDERAEILRTLSEAAKDLVAHRVLYHTCLSALPDARCRSCRIVAAIDRLAKTSPTGLDAPSQSG